MLQEIFGAPRRVASPLFSRALGVVALAAGLLAAAPVAYGQAMAAAVGVYRPSVSKFFLDGNYDGGSDFKEVFGGAPGDVGLLADVTGSGARAPVIYRNGVWYFDNNRDGIADKVAYFGGAPVDIPLVGDLTGTGKDSLVLYRNGIWFVSGNADGVITATYGFGGAPVDVPMIADVNGTGSPALVIFRNGVWFVSSARNGVVDQTFYFGAAGDIPALFDYDGDGKADLCIFRNGLWYVSTNRNSTANVMFAYGTTGDRPLYAGAGAISNPTFDAARFLNQAAFGPKDTEIPRVINMGYASWIDDQFVNATKTNLPPMGWADQNQPNNCTKPLTPGGPPDPFGTDCPRDVYSQFQVQRYFVMNALTAPDQLRQRVAWALSQILVTSAANDSIAYANRDYQQLMIDGAFGNFRNLLFQVSVSPLMGNYLDMVNNDKANPVTGQQPNENYAREIMQLFSIGTLYLNNDGTVTTDLQGQPIQTYDQTDITELAKIMTGWTYFPKPGVPTVSWNAPVNYQGTMQPCQGTFAPPNCGTTNHHDITIKTVLGYTFNPNLTADSELSVALDVIFYHPNVPPFISKQLIQHLVSSNPSPAYVNRIANVFINNGSGVRGDLKAVVKAILLDPEARQKRNPVGTTFGKLKEPVVLLANFLRTMGAISDGNDVITKTRSMGQDIYTSPTVFNYYPADYVIPGTTLAGPQFGIYDPTLLFARVNAIYAWTLGANCPALTPNLCGPSPSVPPTITGELGTKIDWSNLAAGAGNTTTLVDTVSFMFLYTTLPPALRTRVINAVNAVPAGATQMRDRARTAVYLLANSPKYQLEF